MTDNPNNLVMSCRPLYIVVFGSITACPVLGSLPRGRGFLMNGVLFNMLDGVLASYIHVMNNVGDGLFRIVTTILGGLVMWCLVVLARWIIRKSSLRSRRRF